MFWIFVWRDRKEAVSLFLIMTKWNYFPRNWLFVRGIHRSPVNSPHKGQWRGALMFSLIGTRINGWVDHGEAGDWRRYRTHYKVIVMSMGAAQQQYRSGNQLMTKWSNITPWLVTWRHHNYLFCQVETKIFVFINLWDYLRMNLKTTSVCQKYYMLQRYLRMCCECYAMQT